MVNTQHIPPVELRVDFAKYAREGQLSSIEDWLKQQESSPQLHAFLQFSATDP